MEFVSYSPSHARVTCLHCGEGGLLFLSVPTPSPTRVRSWIRASTSPATMLVSSLLDAGRRGRRRPTRSPRTDHEEACDDEETACDDKERDDDEETAGDEEEYEEDDEEL